MTAERVTAGERRPDDAIVTLEADAMAPARLPGDRIPIDRGKRRPSSDGASGRFKNIDAAVDRF